MWLTSIAKGHYLGSGYSYNKQKWGQQLTTTNNKSRSSPDSLSPHKKATVAKFNSTLTTPQKLICTCIYKDKH